MGYFITSLLEFTAKSVGGIILKIGSHLAFISEHGVDYHVQKAMVKVYQRVKPNANNFRFHSHFQGKIRQ